MGVKLGSDGFFREFLRILYALALGASLFGVAFTCFIGFSQHVIWHPSPHSHGFSTKTTNPQSSHSYCSPFFLTKKSPSKKQLYYYLFPKNIRISNSAAKRNTSRLIGSLSDSSLSIPFRRKPASDCRVKNIMRCLVLTI